MTEGQGKSSIAQLFVKWTYNSLALVICLLSRLIVLGFKDISTLVGHFMLSPREKDENRQKRE